ncbi:MAG: 3-methyl-2-oxobutanoate hydroxymethyltransferase, partial [bacterium]|nr:3-methyl-2-oxobutanoate hydroxymethyltransferase [bacterium]
VEGGSKLVPLIQKLVDTGVPVMGHLGLQPQMVLQYGGFLLQGNSCEAAERMFSEAIAIQEAGVFSIVLEKIPAELAEKLTHELKVPTIGIASGVNCDGQILVYHDLLGMQPEVNFKFVRRYANLGDTIQTAVKQYANDVRTKEFPSVQESYFIN